MSVLVVLDDCAHETQIDEVCVCVLRMQACETTPHIHSTTQPVCWHGIICVGCVWCLFSHFMRSRCVYANAPHTPRCLDEA